MDCALAFYGSPRNPRSRIRQDVDGERASSSMEVPQASPRVAPGMGHLRCPESPEPLLASEQVLLHEAQESVAIPLLLRLSFSS